MEYSWYLPGKLQLHTSLHDTNLYGLQTQGKGVSTKFAEISILETLILVKFLFSSSQAKVASTFLLNFVKVSGIKAFMFRHKNINIFFISGTQYYS